MRKYWFKVVNFQNISSVTSDVFLVSCVKTVKDFYKTDNLFWRIGRKKVDECSDVIAKANVLTICVVKLDAVPLVD